MLRNKRGWIRTLEAVIAVLLILGFVLFLNQDSGDNKKVPPDVKVAQNFILGEILTNPEIRNCILEDSVKSNLCSALKPTCWDSIRDLIDSRLPKQYSYSCEICNTPTSCVGIADPSVRDRSWYTGTVFLSATEQETKAAKVVRLYIWEKD